MAEAEDLPKTIVRRVVKEKLSTCSEDGDIAVHRDALLAFSESAKIFIHYLSATANDICRESKRQIINAEDVFKALDETEFTEFVSPLKASLEEFRKKNAGKKVVASKEKGDEENARKKAVASKEKGDEENAGKKVVASKEKGDEKNSGKKAVASKEKGDKKKKRKLEAEPSDKGDGGDDDQ